MQKQDDNKKRSTRRMETTGTVEVGVDTLDPRTELERHGGEFVGAFTAPDGEYRCFLAAAGGEGLLYDLPPSGPALCLAWLAGPLGEAGAEAESEGEAEAKAVFASYSERAAAEGGPLCRAVGAEDVERLLAPEGEGREDGEAQAPGERRAA